MCRLQAFVHAKCHCTSYDLRTCRKLPPQCPSCPSPRQSKYIIQPKDTASFIPECLSACPSLTQHPIQLHPLPCQNHMRLISPELQREIVLGEIPLPREKGDDDDRSDRGSIHVDANGKIVKVDKPFRWERPGVRAEPANCNARPDPSNVGLSERFYGNDEWRERSVAEILEDGRVEDGEGYFRRKRVQPPRKASTRPWYSPCRWIWGKY